MSQIANTESLDTNFNVAPYYDDYNESKNYHRILFRPGYAVQARELTQLQTILQNQIDRLGEHVFKDGSIVRGMEMNYNSQQDYVQLKDNNAQGNEIDISNFEGKTITANNGISANVITVLDGNENESTKKTLYVTYTSAANSDNVTKKFSNNQILQTKDGFSANVITSSDSTGVGSIIRFGDGVLFAKDHFIRVEDQIAVIGKYSPNTSVNVGYDISEVIVNSNEDETLLDPARGAYNFAAPGSNRLKLSPKLTVKNKDEDNLKDFVDIVRIRNGKIERSSDKPLYNKIADYVADRTYNESGHYISDGLELILREHLKQSNNNGVFKSSEGGNTELLSADVKPGTAYVFGYERKNLTTKHVEVDKGIDFKEINAGTITANYGNNVRVNHVCGHWDYNTHDKVSLRDNKQRAIFNNEFSSGVSGNEIGTARVRAMQYVSGAQGSPDAEYRAYLYDINMTGGSFEDVRSIYYNSGSSDGKADIVLSSSNTAVLEDITFNTGVYPFPSEAIRRVRDEDGNTDTSFQFLKKFNVSISSSGTFTVSTGDVNERFIDTGIQNDIQKRENFYVVLDNAAESSSAVAVGNATDGSNTITGITNADDKFNVGDRIRLDISANTYVVSNVATTEISTYSPIPFSATSNNIFKSYVSGSVIDMAGNGGDGGERSINVTSSTDASFDIKETFTNGVGATVLIELNRVNAQEKTKEFKSDRYVQLDLSTNSGGTTGPWNLGFADVFQIKEVRRKSGAFTSSSDGVNVTSEFILDDGQRDNTYNLGHLEIGPDSNITLSSSDHLLVKLDYFTQDSSQGVGYFSVDSYPIDDSNASNTQAITTATIPEYRSPITGDLVNLRDVIDIRPRVNDTSSDSTVVSGATTNPSNTHQIQESTGGGLRFAAPNENFNVDYSFYLPRIDRIIIDKDGRFRNIRGTSAINPNIPPSSDDGFDLGYVKVSPFPSVVGYTDKEYGDTIDYSEIIQLRQENYTMGDISVLEDRIKTLEYYTTLNLLEQSTESLNIPDGNGLNRFKSGFLADSFNDEGSVDSSTRDFKAFIDAGENKLYPEIYEEFTKLDHKTSKSTNVQLAPSAVRLTVSNSGTFELGETISDGSGSGILRYQFDTTRLYIDDVSGTFSSSGTVTGSSSGATANIQEKKTYPNGNLLTLPYTETLMIQQNIATGTRNASGLAYSWEGTITLDPEVDIWVETERRTRRRSRTVRRSRERDAINGQGVAIARAGRAAGQLGPHAQRLVDQGGLDLLRREGAQIGTRTTRDVDVDRDVRRSVREEDIPFIRAQDIEFKGEALKPNGRMFPFFDGVAVSEYCYPTDSNYNPTGNLGDPLITDSQGIVYGVFQLPNNNSQRFETGTLNFKLIDNIQNSEDQGDYTSLAEEDFRAQGTRRIITRTIVTTRTITTTRTRVYDDPIAQTFRVEDAFASEGVDRRNNPSNTPGMFLTSVDLFFASKDRGNLPVEIQIREVDPSSGYVTNNLVPHSKVVVQPDDININARVPVPTPIYFPTPIYLLSDMDYALVIKPGGGSPNYSVWTARLGENDIVRGNRVSENPYLGLLFVSANDRAWTAVQEEDLTFNMYFADFGKSQKGTSYFNNIPSEYFTISNTDLELDIGQRVHGETKLVLSSTPSANVGEIVQGISSGANGTLTSISSNTHTVKDVTLDSKYNTGEGVRFLFANGVATGANSTISSQSTPKGKIGYINPNLPNNGRMTLTKTEGTFEANSQFKEQNVGYTGQIDSISNIKVHEGALGISEMQLQDTVTLSNAKFATGTSTLESNFSEIPKATTSYFDNTKYILGQSQEDSNIGGSDSAEFKIDMFNGGNNRHSPAIDLDQVGFASTEYFINNDSTGETNNKGGNADVRYITKTVTLKEGLDAEDLKVFVTGYSPPSSSILVYAKMVNSSDSQTINEKNWEQLVKQTNSTVSSKEEDRHDYIEFEYNLSNTVLTGPGGEYQYTNGGVTYTGYKYFKIKIVMLSTNPAHTPALKSLRAIALQI